MSKLKLILKIITFPIWFPWKLLFIRKEGKKYNQVDLKIRLFRIVRSPITKPLKFLLFIFILVFEIGIIYKIRYSIITYPITKYQVESYYIKKEDKKLLGIPNVYAKDISNYTDDLNITFKYIDEWNLFEKNRMYSIFNSKLIKIFFEYANEDVIMHLINKFNNEEEYREGIRKIIKNSNSLIPHFAKEFVYMLDGDLNNIDGIELIVGNVSSFSLYAVDFNFVLDGLGIYASYDGEHDFKMFTTDTVDAIFELGKYYNEGKSLIEATDIACSKYTCGW